MISHLRVEQVQLPPDVLHRLARRAQRNQVERATLQEDDVCGACRYVAELVAHVTDEGDESLQQPHLRRELRLVEPITHPGRSLQLYTCSSTNTGLYTLPLVPSFQVQAGDLY